MDPPPRCNSDWLIVRSKSGEYLTPQLVSYVLKVLNMMYAADNNYCHG